MLKDLFERLTQIGQESNDKQIDVLNSIDALKAMFNYYPHFIHILDTERNFLYCNDKVERLLGYSNDEFLEYANKFEFFLSENSQPSVLSQLNRALNGEVVQFESEALHKSGELVSVYMTHCPIIVDGDVIGLYGVTKDITEITTDDKKQLKEIEAHFQSMYHNLDIAFWSIDMIHNRVIHCSNAIEKLVGYTVVEFEENIGLWEEIIFPEDHIKIEERRKRLVKGEQTSIQYRIYHSNGEVRWIEEQTIPVQNELGDVIRIDGVIEDITSKKQLEEKLEQITMYDYLTGLPNRWTFEQKLEQAIAQAKERNEKLAVFFLDLDKFKHINDNLGYKIGDKMLNAVAQRLRVLSNRDVFVARTRGDEFALFHSGAQSDDDIYHLSNSIVETLRREILIEDFKLYITTSMGVSIFPNDGTDVYSLLNNADIALTRAKEAGGDKWKMYASSMSIEAYKMFVLGHDLRRALEAEEFYLEYQPIVTASDGLLIGMEALIRWSNRDWGNVSPGVFIPLAESNGMIWSIENWVLKTVCNQLNEWKKAGVELLPISVNLSPNRLLRANFIENTLETVRNAGIEPKWIKFELTERSVIENEALAKSVIKQLSEEGFLFSLDDVGTGYSSMALVSVLNLDCLKIDRSFINQMMKENRSKSIVKALVYLGKELNIPIIAEGVETIEQLEFLRQIECSNIQGFIFSKPVKSERLMDYMQLGRLEPAEQSERKQQVMKRRKYFRVEFPSLLQGEMTISSFKGKAVQLGSSKILIADIGLGGLHFYSNVDMPVHPEIVLTFTTEQLSVRGTVEWKRGHKGYYEYGVQFRIDEIDRIELQQRLDQLTSEIEHNDHSCQSSYQSKMITAFFNTKP
ncbi:EAL domain-containing protein [Bacillus solimangrovi]|uniref:Diguanylate cyclase n=1 Tax=Bacillus solimangrovi TaxID=1305675 RepID=A0A1E5LD03_9BACI|nr:EAL domain-containing protein [Bacillus solimangrovi]OEH91954.1 hypothetical protein BFG57_17490 [Bacillus solimangrovi]